MTGYGIRMEINPNYLTGKLPPELIPFYNKQNEVSNTMVNYFYNDLLSTVSAIVLSLILFTDVLEPKENQSELTSDQDAY